MNITKPARQARARLQAGHSSVAARWGLLLLVATVMGACASYEPPKPGQHRAPGEPVSEAICGYETPTASRFLQMRCRSAEDANRMAADAREAADSIRTPPPDIK